MLELLKGLVAQTSLTLSELQLQQLVAYVQLLDKWNSAYNLTSVRDPKEMLVKHIMDSLAVVPHVQGKKIIDVGTGPGLPGVPLAIALPEKNFVLLDSLGKRIRFLNQVKLQLKQSNIEPVQSRVEDHDPQGGYDAVLSRAFASMTDMVNWCQHLPHQSGQFLAMKGALVQEEIAALPNFVKVVGSYPLSVPTLNAERYLVVLEKNQN
ncbi:MULTISPECIES: 16S rRNA (guanine(527)-N(7))-methyltransferase RsmG [Rheinheimera]|uniref:Ribosomal RNA small subunit methyltransferase G n=1 Tax=Rheinheimera marina TaxID=1774958 RepID=A0ABV9JQN6_9GAMM